MTIETLIEAVPPPAAPTYVFDGPWEPIEAELGTPLPQDYKELVRLYGDGRFADTLRVNTPNSPSIEGQLVAEAYATQKLFVEMFPHIPMYPQPGGLLTCGATDTGDHVFWLTRGPVSEWPIVAWERGDSELHEAKLFECDLTQFVAAFVRGEVWNEPSEAGDSPVAAPLFKSTLDPWPWA